MRRLPFVPAREPRHRAAALALYRALVRSARQVPLPGDVVGAPARTIPMGPIADGVRTCFVRNRAYTSLRLVYASMAAGYKFLAVLARARDAASPDNAQLVAHLRTRSSSVAAQTSPSSAAGASRRRKPAHVPEPRPEPLIVNTAAEGHPPRYASSTLPRPHSTLDAAGLPRRVPSLCSTADGQPFLRMAKPQPRALSRMVGRKDRIFQRKIYKIVEIDEDLVPAAVLEDQWDGLVAEQMRREGVRDATATLVMDASAARGGGPKASYSWSVQLARLWWEWQVERTWQDWTARGTALNQLVEEERALAERERSGSARQSPVAPKPPARTKDGTRPNVAEHPAPPLPLLSAIATRLGDGGAILGKDPFVSAAWATLVDAEQPRLMKWLARGAGTASR
ncbi:ubiquitin-conjugating enzyme [Purpureocillium lavendulum]|uniref:Ubiquitin-conjugating enzyme n=1 Tax=Purpureocillium lavendulum TaxID=1247861 RepID=A0AB34FJS6_9HYPO|nr:ubiquitin-conjugating enzyme [Purpureocillium lavendulum]